ncbi:phytanoyl-CoA dioxygenase family protein [Chitinibacter bivalviorum]|uniref:Phytanoyl-CoA dioxygenase family protein n=1 Tax=Chitinibacter bivalviorum TaxID=2739434 RepID=A0A7H9BJ28_9NEIS|nr:phytanoyl-CoA dioxygenase family protein [Chitinibacter bivalviorum]QLG88650.1 phytanoyl-CoA dioxygenase family protein [Chitinibacter bivalviorum]
MAITSFSDFGDVNAIAQVFARDGVVVLRSFAPAEQVAAIRAESMRQLELRLPPLELEAELGYPGAPKSSDAQGAATIRRLRGMATRAAVFMEWAGQQSLLQLIAQLLGSREITLTQAHHNSLMTKQPSFSSDTLWHRDVRYWRFARPELVSSWLALGDESPANGGLGFIVGSHLASFPDAAFDEREFLLPQHPSAAPWVAKAEFPTLAAGDVVLFDARTFHAASRNSTTQTKYSLVFSYHASDNLPQSGSRSASVDGISWRLDG